MSDETTLYIIYFILYTINILFNNTSFNWVTVVLICKTSDPSEPLKFITFLPLRVSLYYHREHVDDLLL